jgi:hypothetical protein
LNNFLNIFIVNYNPIIYHKNMTDLELQRWLAAQLTEEIEAGIGIDRRPCFWWRKNNNPITALEWLHVVSLVEAQLTADQWFDYADNLPIKYPQVTGNTWQQRTRPLMEVLK